MPDFRDILGGSLFPPPGPPHVRPPQPDDYDNVCDEAQVDEKLRRILSGDLGKILAYFSDHEWHTVEEVAAHVERPQPGVSAQCRDLRKQKYGEYRIDGYRFPHDKKFRYKLLRPDESFMPKPKRKGRKHDDDEDGEE